MTHRLHGPTLGNPERVSARALIFGAKTPDAKPNMDEIFVKNNGRSGSALINSILNQPHTL